MNEAIKDLEERISDAEYAEKRGIVNEPQDIGRLARLTAQYERVTSVCGTETLRELDTLWYIRNSGRGFGYHVYLAAKKQYEACEAFYALYHLEPKPRTRRTTGNKPKPSA